MAELSNYSKFIHLSRYARWDDHKKRRETWTETVDRYIGFFQNKFPTFPGPTIREAILHLKVMPSMRCLMTAGPALERDNIAGFNCIPGDTLVTTLEYGIVPIQILSGQSVHIVDGNGAWTLAHCHSFGCQPLMTITFKTSGKGSFKVRATPNHRWILRDGSEKQTQQLVEGDRLASVKMPERPSIDESSDDYIKGIQHGIVFGDGNASFKNKINRQGTFTRDTFVEKTCGGYYIRLCGQKVSLASNFKNYSITYPSCLNGDALISITDRAINLKELPAFEGVTDDYLTGFIRGWIATDGSSTKNSSQPSLTSKREHLEWLLTVGPRLGFVPHNWKFDTEFQTTNFGKSNFLMGYICFDRRWLTQDDFIRDDQREAFIKVDPDRNPGFGMVKSIEDLGEVEDVFCFDVPTTHSFLLTKNLLTGNCSYVAIDHPRAFDEILYILMCFSPDTLIKTKNGSKKIYELTQDDEVLSFDETTRRYEFIRPSQIIETPSSEKEKIELTLEDGTTIRCTADHRFLTENRGWVEAKDLTEEDDIKNWHELA